MSIGGDTQLEMRVPLFHPCAPLCVVSLIVGMSQGETGATHYEDLHIEG